MAAKSEAFDPFALPVPTAGRKLYADPDARGHSVRVSADGERVAYFYRKVAGDPVKIALGVFDPAISKSRELERNADPFTFIANRPPLNLRMARALALAVGLEVAKGNNPAHAAREARRAKAGELTLGDAFDRYERDHLEAQGRRTAADLRALFERYIGALPDERKRPHGRERTKSDHGVDWSRRKLSEIDANDVRSLMVSLKDGHGASTANRAFELLRTMFNRLRDWHLFEGDNPCAGLSKFPEHSRERFLRGDELPAFFAAFNALAEGAFKDFVALALYTGARRGNVLGMRWADVDLHAGLWSIPATASKSGKPMTLPLTRRALDVLERRRAADPQGAFAFPADSKSEHMTPPKKQWAAFVKAAKLEDFRFHDLRRSAGSWAAMTGASLPIIGKALGHKSAASTEIYARLQTDPVLAALQRAQDAMLHASGAPKADVLPVPRRGRTRRGPR